MQESQCKSVKIRDKCYRVRQWGADGASLLFMLHGWLDCSASFQFVVDSLRRPWHVIAPDWRGHGGSHRTGETYPFLQLIADLDGLLEHFSPAEPVRIVGHSLGANVASIYAGSRPERVRSFISLEGLAPIPRRAIASPTERIAQWLDVLRKGVGNRPYRHHAAMAERLRQGNSRLTPDRAAFLAREFSWQRPDGQYEFAVDPYEHAPSPLIGHDAIVESAWPRIMAPVLLFTAGGSEVVQAFDSSPEILARRIALFRYVERVHVEDAGHNIHHDQPEQVALAIEHFLAQREGTISA